MDTSFRTHVSRAVKIAGSQRKLAELANVSQQLISQLCTSASTITKETAIAISSATDGEVSIADLLPEVTEAVRAELSRKAAAPELAAS